MVRVIEKPRYTSLQSFVDKANIKDEPVFNENTGPKKQCYPTNTRALSKEAATYELENFEKHALIIFDHENYTDSTPRLGTENDVKSLIKTFTNFGFEATRYKDLNKDELLMELKKFSETDFTDYGCVAVAVLTHGTNNGLLRAKDQLYSETEIINHFRGYNKPSLVTKPKLIIIQASRGTENRIGVPVFQSGKIRKYSVENLEPHNLLVEPDFLIIHSCYAGSVSYSDGLSGSWFIQELCNKINTLSPAHDFESIITEVKREIAINKQHEVYNKRTLEFDVNKQMPVMMSTLIRKLYLRKFGEEPMEKTHVNKLGWPSESKREVQDAGSTRIVVNHSPTTRGLVQFGAMLLIFGSYLYEELFKAHR